ncbi:MAG: hypothetical protein BMS9Abin29_1254 [Gemmatimonadota bacterium]|nr:MAG: hypothetical protein BMS9Abin29_1254 [Gemmatimonadota bacterium]
MDPESLLFVEVVGMIVVAGFLTLSLRREEESGSTDVSVPLPSVSTTVLCPGWKCTAEVVIGVRERGADTRLGIMACDLLLEGESCDESCVTPVVQA